MITATVAVDPLHPGLGVLKGGRNSPEHPGQSGQPMPESVARTITPTVTSRNVVRPSRRRSSGSGSRGGSSLGVRGRGLKGGRAAAHSTLAPRLRIGASAARSTRPRLADRSPTLRLVARRAVVDPTLRLDGRAAPIGRAAALPRPRVLRNAIRRPRPASAAAAGLGDPGDLGRTTQPGAFVFVLDEAPAVARADRTAPSRSRPGQTEAVARPPRVRLGDRAASAACTSRPPELPSSGVEGCVHRPQPYLAAIERSDVTLTSVDLADRRGRRTAPHPTRRPQPTSTATSRRSRPTPSPDPAFYEIVGRRRPRRGRPFVLVFATPAFCQSAQCGPTLDRIKPVAAAHPDVTFINVEPYQLEYIDGRLEPVLDANGHLQAGPDDGRVGPPVRAVGLRRRPRGDRRGLVRGDRRRAPSCHAASIGEVETRLARRVRVLEPVDDVLAALVRKNPTRIRVDTSTCARRGARAGTRAVLEDADANGTRSRRRSGAEPVTLDRPSERPR